MELMGYLTWYTVNIEPANEELYSHLVHCGYCEHDQCKWYSYRDDCLYYSLHYPNHLIIVQGTGEESGDMWKKAFMNGQIVWKWKLEVAIPDVPKDLYGMYYDNRLFNRLEPILEEPEQEQYGQQEQRIGWSEYQQRNVNMEDVPDHMIIDILRD